MVVKLLRNVVKLLRLVIQLLRNDKPVVKEWVSVVKEGFVDSVTQPKYRAQELPLHLTLSLFNFERFFTPMCHFSQYVHKSPES